MMCSLTTSVCPSSVNACLLPDIHSFCTCKMDIISSLDPLSIAVGVGIGAILSILLGRKSSGICNPSIMKSEPKVATVCPLKDIEDAVSKSDKGVVAYCRCWRSKKFPYCDGSHMKFNKESGDNTGPLVVKA